MNPPTTSSCARLMRNLAHAPVRIPASYENEKLVELANRTVHAAALSTLVETANAYRFYFGIYVRSVSRFTPIYMALIDPARKLVVYPSLLRSVRATWARTYFQATQ